MIAFNQDEYKTRNELLTAFTLARNDLREFLEHKVEAWREEYEEKCKESEDWEESEEGEAVSDWLEQWESIMTELDEFNIEDDLPGDAPG